MLRRGRVGGGDGVLEGEGGRDVEFTFEKLSIVRAGDDNTSQRRGRRDLIVPELGEEGCKKSRLLVPVPGWLLPACIGRPEEKLMGAERNLLDG